jgi:hypothetical protein
MIYIAKYTPNHRKAKCGCRNAFSKTFFLSPPVICLECPKGEKDTYLDLRRGNLTPETFCVNFFCAG